MTMAATELLRELAARGVRLWFEGERLRFRAPKGAMPPELREALVARRAEVLAALHAEAAARTQDTELSYSQRSLWLVNREDPGSAAYNVAFAARVVSRIDAAALRQALQALVDRHAMLRAVYPLVDGMPMQRIAGRVEVALAFHDLSAFDEAALRARVEASYARAFDLEQGPIFRADVFSRGPAEHVLLLNVHHIAADGWSLMQMLDELRALYAEAAGGAAAALGPPDASYLDFTHWQRDMLASAEGARLVDYWKRQLAAPRAQVEVSPDRRRPQRRSSRGATHAFELGPRLCEALRRLARDEGTTMFVVLLAAFETLLYRHSGTEDILVGTPTFGRNKPEFANVVGHFVNPVVLRSQLAPNTPFRDLVAQLRKTVLDALDAQDCPFALVVESLQPPRDPSRAPLFETLFVMQRFEQFREFEPLMAPNADGASVEFGGLRLAHFELRQQEGQFDLTLQAVDRGEAIELHFKYNADLYDAAAVQRLAGHLTSLLEGVVADPSQPLSSYALLADAERRELLERAGAVAARDAPSWTLHARFEEQARRTPEAIALACEGASMSYAELNRRANRLAHRLRARGVGRETLVGLCCAPSLDLVVALLAILKAGGAYLPIDLAYPADRVAFMLEDAKAPVLVTQRELRDRLPGYAGEKVFVDDASADEPDSDLAHVGAPDDLVYVIYTSGSTGRPKGTMLTHRAVQRLFTATDAWYRFGPGDVWTMFHSVAFDFSVWEIWGALLYGGRLVVVPHGTSRDPVAFLRLLRDEGVTVLNQTPSAFGQLAQADLASGAPHATRLRYVIFGGEALELQRLRPWFERHGDARPRLVNMYGITETCVHVTYRPIGLADLAAGAGSVIGEPIPDLRVHVLDAQMQPMPYGVIGEMYVGGPGLARGYLGRPELTAQRFVPDPFVPEERLYRTGDLARRRASGELEYLGRIDHQVKIRGFRIELGEIESALARCDGVGQSVVVVREDAPGDKRLVAYLVGADREAEAAIRQRLLESLPDYMVPSAFVFLDGLPLTSNGKVDTRALPAPERTEVGGRAHDPPRTATERLVATIWEELLGRTRIGRDDNFFELGGHSLLVVKLVQKLREQGFGIDVAAVFVHSRLSSLAAAADERAGADAPHAPPQAPVARDPAQMDRIAAAAPGGRANVAHVLSLLHQQEGMLFHHRLASGDRADVYQGRAIMAVEGRALLDRLLAALQTIVDRHEALRTAVLWTGLSEPVQVVLHKAPLQVRKVAVEEGHSAAQALMEATDPLRFRMSLGSAPLVVPFVARDPGADSWHLALVVHHIVMDHVSTGILATELFEIAQGRAQGLPAPTPFREIAAPAQRVPWEEHEAFFKRMLGEVTRASLPLGLADVQGDGRRTQERTFHADADLAASIRSAAAAEHVGPAAIAHVAWAMVVARCCQSRDAVFGSVLYGRSQVEGAQNAMGMFINTLPLRVNLEEGSASSVVRKTFEALGLLMRHEHAPLALAQRCSSVPPGEPLFSAIINYRHAGAWGGGMDGVRVEYGEERTNYPLMLAVDESDAGFAFHVQAEKAEVAERALRLLGDAVGLLTRRLAEDRALAAAVTVPPACAALLDALSLITPDERRQLTIGFNETERAFEPATFISLFERQAGATPGARALMFEGATLTYAELDSWADAIAHRLRESGVAAGDLVGVCLPRSLQLVVALLAAHKAGAGYVPLDPGFPAKRLEYMLKDSEAAVVLVPEVAGAAAAVPAGIRAVGVGETAPAAEGRASPGAARADTDVAYVIYTSGSTGLPKGVAISQGALSNFLQGMRLQPGLASHDVFAAVTTISFDIAVLEIFLPLVVGACVDLVSRDTTLDGHALARRLSQCGATALQATPATWRLLLEADWPGQRGLRAFCGGEALPRELAQRLLPRVAELWNLYGPTETTVWSTAERVSDAGDISIGRPIANTRIYVLDPDRNPLPAGVAGEIWIGGAGVALGYHRRPELTAERFLADPFAGVPGARMYATGDLGHWDDTGRLHHLGRMDRQVKIRGFRIEIGEIEAALAGHPGVRQCVVDAREDTPGDKRLVAYVVSGEGQGFDADAARAMLRERLPEYMVPSLFVTLERIPLTPNGKVDRKALPAPQAANADAAHVVMTPDQRRVAALWTEVLGVPHVGLHTNFFDMGGHSLLLAKLHTGLQREFRRELPLVELFQWTTVSAQAERFAAPRKAEPALSRARARAAKQDSGMNG